MAPVNSLSLVAYEIRYGLSQMVAVRLFGCIVFCCWVCKEKKKRLIPSCELVIDLFFFGQFFDEMAIVEAMQERCFCDFAEIVDTVSNGKDTKLFVNTRIDHHG